MMVQILSWKYGIDEKHFFYVIEPILFNLSYTLIPNLTNLTNYVIPTLYPYTYPNQPNQLHYYLLFIYVIATL